MSVLSKLSSKLYIASRHLQKTSRTIKDIQVLSTLNPGKIGTRIINRGISKITYKETSKILRNIRKYTKL